MIIFGVHYSGVDLLLSCLTLGNWPSDWLFSFHWIPVGIYLRFFFSSGRTVGAFKITEWNYLLETCIRPPWNSSVAGMGEVFKAALGEMESAYVWIFHRGYFV